MHSRLFKLIQDECDCDDEPEDEIENKTMIQRRDCLSLPLKQPGSDPESFSSSGFTSPGSPTINDKILNEIIQNLIMKKQGKVFKNMNIEKLQAAALRILQEDMNECYLNFNDYSQYYDSWSDAERLYDGYDIVPSKAFRLLQEHSATNRTGAIAGLLARCPRVLSNKNVQKELMKLIECQNSPTSSPEPEQSPNVSEATKHTESELVDESKKRSSTISSDDEKWEIDFWAEIINTNDNGSVNKDSDLKQDSSSTCSSDSSLSSSAASENLEIVTACNDEEEKPDNEVKPLTIQERIKSLQDYVASKKFQDQQDTEVKISIKERISQLKDNYNQLTINAKSHKTNSCSRKSSIKSYEGCSEEEGDSGVTSDVSRHVSEVESDLDFFENRKNQYQRALTHSRLFKLLQDECDCDDEPEVEIENKTMIQRRDCLSLPLKQPGSDPESFSSSGFTSPGSPTINDKIVNEIIQNLIVKKQGKVFKNMNIEKLQAAALRILQEDMDGLETLSSSEESGTILDPKKSEITNVPTECYLNFNDYSQYYDSWSDAERLYDGYDIVPSKAFRLLQEHSATNRTGAIAGLLARCPRVLSNKNVQKELMKPIECQNSPTSSPVPEQFPNELVPVLVLALMLQNVIGNDFIVQRTENGPPQFENNEESDIVGNAAARAHAHAVRARARARGLTRRTKLRLHRPHLLREETPEEFLNPNPQFNDPDPILGSPALFNPPPPEFYAAPSNWEPTHAPYYKPNPSYDTVLPENHKCHNYQQEHYETYEITPISFVIPDNYQEYYRSADPHKKSKKGKKIVRENDEENNSQRHFHLHKAHPHAHNYHGNAPIQDPQPHLYENQNAFHATYPQLNLHESFSSNKNFHTIPSQEHQVTTNQQKTVIVLPPHNGNFQISQVNGNQNSVSQSQAFSNLENHHPQAGKVFDQAPFVGYAPDPIVGAPNIVSVGRNRKIWQIPGPDEADVSVVIKRSIPDKTSFIRHKRTVQLARLLLDPNAQMDVPKTLENAGTAVRSSFENKHTPAYHFRNAMGSAKDIIMSTLRIPPQDLFIPSRYKIVKKDSYINPMEKSNANNEITKEYPETYNKMGTMFRDSIRSGQDVLTQMGDVIHSTRRALTTSRSMAPRVVVSSLRVPAVQHPLISPIKKAQHNEDVSARYSEDPNFIGVSHILDSLGLSNPQVPNIEFDPRMNNAEDKYYIVSDAPDKEDMYKTIVALNDAVKMTGSNTLKDFFSKLRNLKMKQGGSKAKNVSRPKRVKNKDFRADAIDVLDMAVSLASNVTNELLDDKSTEVPWDSKEDKEVADFLTRLFNRTKNDNVEKNEIDDYDEQVGAINPVMYKRMFNTSLKPLEDEHPAQQDEDDAVGISMTMGKKLVTPFMGKLEKQEVHGYVYDDSESDEDYYDDYRKRRSYVNFIK
ncbi:hypothetical protein RN001_014139 [Aquatica leii]|uniref:Uncharacterized protein n=1 Tax=Aquatica leii TaxID=1421715 RepID=A0AAN7P162_9COLE|nr:hypothetical protein RN001_014139 [Aquatica leii]